LMLSDMQYIPIPKQKDMRPSNQTVSLIIKPRASDKFRSKTKRAYITEQTCYLVMVQLNS
jgi:hypothetical protein